MIWSTGGFEKVPFTFAWAFGPTMLEIASEWVGFFSKIYPQPFPASQGPSCRKSPAALFDTTGLRDHQPRTHYESNRFKSTFLNESTCSRFVFVEKYGFGFHRKTRYCSRNFMRSEKSSISHNTRWRVPRGADESDGVHRGVLAADSLFFLGGGAG